MLTAQELKSSPLFHDISYEEYRRMLTCFQAAQRSYVPEEQVYDFTSSRTDAVGIVERGQVSLIRIDEAGVATVLEDMGPGGVFGRHLAFAGFATDSLEVVARTACDILFIDNSCIFKRCENACTHHSTLVYNMMNLLSNKTRSLSERVDVLSRRSIREKLLCYFRQQTEKSGEDVFTLPFSLSVLADYIATDRSAMMRELRHLKEQGIVCTDGRQIKRAGLWYHTGRDMKGRVTLCAKCDAMSAVRPTIMIPMISVRSAVRSTSRPSPPPSTPTAR